MTIEPTDDPQTDAELFAQALAKLRYVKPPPMSNVVLVVREENGKKADIEFNGVVRGTEVEGVINPVDGSIRRVQMEVSTMQIENRAEEARQHQIMQRMASVLGAGM
jgi:hypothetical protein